MTAFYNEYGCELSRLMFSPSPSEVERGKELLKTQYLLSQEGTPQIFDEATRQILVHGRRKSFAEFAHNVDSVTFDEFKKTMHDICYHRDHSSVFCGDPSFIPAMKIHSANKIAPFSLNLTDKRFT